MDPEDPDSDPEQSQNGNISSFYLSRHILKISSKIHPYVFELSVFKITEDPDHDPEQSQNCIISYFYVFRHILKISLKSVHKFL